MLLDLRNENHALPYLFAWRHCRSRDLSPIGGVGGGACQNCTWLFGSAADALCGPCPPTGSAGTLSACVTRPSRCSDFRWGPWSPESPDRTAARYPDRCEAHSSYSESRMGWEVRSTHAHTIYIGAGRQHSKAPQYNSHHSVCKLDNLMKCKIVLTLNKFSSSVWMDAIVDLNETCTKKKITHKLT